jgi:hypothetical protein
MTELERRRRRKFLLLAAASALEDGVSPLGPVFRAEHKVTVAEGLKMVTAMAYAVRYWVADAFAEES